MDDNNYVEFLDITGASRDFVEDINDFLLSNSCKRDIKTAKSGFTVSYLLQATKKTLATFVCRKTGIKLRIYPQNINEYERFLDTLPVKMKKEIIKSSVCKRLINPDDCNPKCVMGYDFIMDGEHYQKCRYMAFMPILSEENNPYIKELLQKELSFQQSVSAQQLKNGVATLDFKNPPIHWNNNDTYIQKEGINQDQAFDEFKRDAYAWKQRGDFVKIQFGGFDVHISEWSAKLKMATIVFAAITAISVALTIFGGCTIPSLSLIALGAMFQLLGIKAYNTYFKKIKSKYVLSAGLVSTLIFAGCFCVGIKQFLDWAI